MRQYTLLIYGPRESEASEDGNNKAQEKKLMGVGSEIEQYRSNFVAGRLERLADYDVSQSSEPGSSLPPFYLVTHLPG